MGFRIHKRKGILLNTLRSLLGHSKGYILRAGQIREKLETYKGDHLITYTCIKSLCCAMETNIILYVNYISLN